MKLLILSDLHISPENVSSLSKLEHYKKILKRNIITDYDAVLISGDVFEHFVPKYVNPFKALHLLFDSKPVVFCLGNHEFAYEKHENVLNKYKELYEAFCFRFPNGNVTCLDISGYHDFETFRIVGNVFWYDWSLNHCRVLMKGEIPPGWLDETIEDFDAMKEHEKCKEQIINSISKTKNHILLTHTVPHESLNTFSREEPYSPYNACSGVKDFFSELPCERIKFAFCGHTHRKENHEINGVNCLNLGNDYYFKTMKIDWAMFDVDDDLNINDFIISKGN